MSGEAKEMGSVDLLEQNLQFQTERIKELEKETHEKFGKMDGKIERIEERVNRQENDITSVKADLTFIKDSVKAFTDDWRAYKKTEQDRSYDQHKQFKKSLASFFVAVAATVVGSALLLAFGLK